MITRAVLDFFGCMLLFAGWLGGMVIAAGAWKVVALFVPPYAIYLFAARLMQMAGII